MSPGISVRGTNILCGHWPIPRHILLVWWPSWTPSWNWHISGSLDSTRLLIYSLPLILPSWTNRCGFFVVKPLTRLLTVPSHETASLDWARECLIFISWLRRFSFRFGCKRCGWLSPSKTLFRTTRGLASLACSKDKIWGLTCAIHAVMVIHIWISYGILRLILTFFLHFSHITWIRLHCGRHWPLKLVQQQSRFCFCNKIWGWPFSSLEMRFCETWGRDKKLSLDSLACYHIVRTQASNLLIIIYAGRRLRWSPTPFVFSLVRQYLGEALFAAPSFSS
jgi:hypothetical protein